MAQTHITPLFHYRAAERPAGSGEDADPIATEIIRHSLNSVAAQMQRALVRTAVSPVIYELNDFAIAIYDPQIQMMAQANTLPGFMGTLNFCVEAAVSAVGGPEALEPGDVLIYSIPYGTGAHAADSAIVAPAFHDGKLIGYICNKAHLPDVGAKDLYCTDSTDVFQEGTLMPGVKLYSCGRRCEDILRIILANSRAPVATAADLNAMVTSALLGARLLTDLVERHGPDVFWQSVARMYDHGEALMRRYIESIPDGRYTGSGYMDDNGLDTNPISFDVAAEVAGGRLVLDFSAVPDAQAGPVNCPMPSTVAGARVAVVMLVNADVLPNEGMFRPIEVITRPGSMFHPVSPQPCFLYGLATMSAMEAINEALSQARHGLSPSGSAGDVAALAVFGKGGEHDEMWAAGAALAVGQGAYAGGDGGTTFVPAMAFATMIPIEIEEAKHPMMFESMEFRPDSGGAGQWRGGLGWQRQFQCLEDCFLISAIQRMKEPSWGQRGGLQGATNRLTLVGPSGEARGFGKGTNVPLPKGTRVRIETGGGGGYGPPAQRDPAAVRRDLREGYITEAHAKAHYPQVFGQAE